MAYTPCQGQDGPGLARWWCIDAFCVCECVCVCALGPPGHPTPRKGELAAAGPPLLRVPAGRADREGLSVPMSAGLRAVVSGTEPLSVGGL
eukprot:1456023-Pyramimonas_sp.AAC.1